MHWMTKATLSLATGLVLASGLSAVRVEPAAAAEACDPARIDDARRRKVDEKCLKKLYRKLGREKNPLIMVQIANVMMDQDVAFPVYVLETAPNWERKLLKQIDPASTDDLAVELMYVRYLRDKGGGRANDLIERVSALQEAINDQRNRDRAEPNDPLEAITLMGTRRDFTRSYGDALQWRVEASNAKLVNDTANEDFAAQQQVHTRYRCQLKAWVDTHPRAWQNHERPDFGTLECTRKMMAAPVP